MKLCIVGGGVSGCIAAIHAVQRGHQVQLLEATDQLGGVMGDLIADGDHFFNGCHYLNDFASWTHELRTICSMSFQSFPHRYGSLTDLLDGPVAHHDFAQPVIRGKLPCLDGTSLQGTSLAERLKSFGPSLGRRITEWSSRYAPPEVIPSSCAATLQLGRLYFPDDEAEVTRRKSLGGPEDLILGLPRSKRQPRQAPELAWLPEQGYTVVFLSLIHI